MNAGVSPFTTGFDSCAIEENTVLAQSVADRLRNRSPSSASVRTRDQTARRLDEGTETLRMRSDDTPKGIASTEKAGSPRVATSTPPADAPPISTTRSDAQT